MPILLFREGGCLFSSSEGMCEDEVCQLCQAFEALSPVVVDCHDPANEWLSATLGECECESRYLCHRITSLQPTDRPRGGETCVDRESCEAVPYGAKGALPRCGDFQPGEHHVFEPVVVMTWGGLEVAQRWARDSEYVFRIERPPELG